jgi:hypothetical protein
VASVLEALQPGVALAVFKWSHIVEPGVPVDLREGYERWVSEHNVPRRFAGCSLIRADAFAAHVARYPTDNCIGEPTATLIHRSAFHQFGSFHPYLIHLNDWEYVARVAVHTGLCYVDEPLATIRVHASSTTARNYARRHYRAYVIDPLVILHDLVYHEAYAPVRKVARHSSPRINLRHHLTYAARQARKRAQQQRASGAGAEALAEWEDAVTQYPRLLALPPGYVLSAAWSRAKGGLRRLRGEVLRP